MHACSVWVYICVCTHCLEPLIVLGVWIRVEVLRAKSEGLEFIGKRIERMQQLSLDALHEFLVAVRGIPKDTGKELRLCLGIAK